MVLTPEGRRAIEEAAPGHVDFVRQVVFEDLTPEQLRVFGEITGAVLRRLDGYCPEEAAAETPEASGATA